MVARRQCVFVIKIGELGLKFSCESNKGSLLVDFCGTDLPEIYIGEVCFHSSRALKS